MPPDEPERWHLQKGIPVALITGLPFQLAGIVWARPSCSTRSMTTPAASPSSKPPTMTCAVTRRASASNSLASMSGSPHRRTSCAGCMNGAWRGGHRARHIPGRNRPPRLFRGWRLPFGRGPAWPTSRLRFGWAIPKILSGAQRGRRRRHKDRSGPARASAGDNTISRDG
jgi:hypothetical protein